MEFPGATEFDAELGELWLPYLDVTLRNGDHQIRARLLVDSGAHLSVIPYHMGFALGLEPDQVSIGVGIAVGGGSVPYRLRRIEMTIGGKVVDARIGWLLDDSTEALLGRLDVFDAFHFEFRQSERTLVVTPARM